MESLQQEQSAVILLTFRLRFWPFLVPQPLFLGLACRFGMCSPETTFEILITAVAEDRSYATDSSQRARKGLCNWLIYFYLPLCRLSTISTPSYDFRINPRIIPPYKQALSTHKTSVTYHISKFVPSLLKTLTKYFKSCVRYIKKLTGLKNQ